MYKKEWKLKPLPVLARGGLEGVEFGANNLSQMFEFAPMGRTLLIFLGHAAGTKPTEQGFIGIICGKQ